MNLNFANLSSQERQAPYILAKQRTISVVKLPMQTILPNIVCLSLVVYGTHLASTLGFTPLVRRLPIKDPLASGEVPAYPSGALLLIILYDLLCFFPR